MKREWLDRIVGVALALMCVLAFVQCGNKGSTKKTVTFSSSPKPSIVIESDYTELSYPSGGTVPVKTTFKGPWIYWYPSLLNTTTSTITVFAVTLEVIAGGITVKKSFTASDLNSNLPYLYQLNPATTPATPVNTIRYAITGLQTRAEIGFLNYFVQGKAVGWYGDGNNPLKSWNTTFSFNASEK